MRAECIGPFARDSVLDCLGDVQLRIGLTHAVQTCLLSCYGASIAAGSKSAAHVVTSVCSHGNKAIALQTQYLNLPCQFTSLHSCQTCSSHGSSGPDSCVFTRRADWHV